MSIQDILDCNDPKQLESSMLNIADSFADSFERIVKDLMPPQRTNLIKLCAASAAITLAQYKIDSLTNNEQAK